MRWASDVGVVRLTTQHVLLRRPGLARRARGRPGLDGLGAFAAVNGILELGGEFLGLAEAVLEGVVGGSVVLSCLAEVDLGTIVGTGVRKQSIGGWGLTLVPVAMMAATMRSQVSASSPVWKE